MGKGKRLKEQRKQLRQNNTTLFTVGEIYGPDDKMLLSEEINRKMSQYSELWISTYETKDKTAIPFALLVDGYMPDALHYLGNHRNEIYSLIQLGYEMNGIALHDSHGYAVITTNPKNSNEQYLCAFVTKEEFLYIGEVMGMAEHAGRHVAAKTLKEQLGDALDIGLNTSDGMLLFM